MNSPGNESTKSLLSLISEADRIELLVDRGGFLDIVEATWFTGSPDDGDENPIVIDSDNDCQATVRLSELDKHTVEDDGRILLQDGRTLTLFSQVKKTKP